MSYTAPVNELRFGIRVHGRLDEILQLPHAEGWMRKRWMRCWTKRRGLPRSNGRTPTAPAICTARVFQTT